MLRKVKPRFSSSGNVFDVIVVGAGSIGVPTTMELQESGLNVLCIDKRSSPGQQDNKCAIGGIRATHSNDSKIIACMRSLEVFSTWKEKHGFDIEWLRGGYLFPVYREVEETTLKSFLPLQQSYGLEIDYVDAKTVQEIVPGIDTEDLRGGIWSPNDGSASPMLSALGFYKYAKEIGAKFHFNEPVSRYIVEDGKIKGVETSKGKYYAKVVVDCAGANSRELGMTAGLDIPVDPDSHEAGITEPTKRFFGPMVVDMRPGEGSKNFYFYQNSFGQVIFCITPDPPIKGFDREETSRFLPMVSKRMVKLLPPLKNIRVRRTWRGLYPMTPDGSPLMGWCREVEGLFIATGMCGQGYMCGPGYAQAIRATINGTVTKEDQIILDTANPYRKFEGMEAFK